MGQARSLGIIFMGTVGTGIFANYYLDPSAEVGGLNQASLLYLLDPVLKLLKNFIIEVYIRRNLTELGKHTVSKVQGLLIALSNRVRHSFSFLKLSVANTKEYKIIRNSTLLKIGIDVLTTIMSIFEIFGSGVWEFAINSNIDNVALFLNERLTNAHELFRAFTMNNIYDIVHTYNTYFNKVPFNMATTVDFAREIMRLDPTALINLPIDIVEETSVDCAGNGVLGSMLSSAHNVVYGLASLVGVFVGGDIPAYSCTSFSNVVLHFNNYNVVVGGSSAEEIAKDTNARKAYLLLLSLGERLTPKKTVTELLADPQINAILSQLGISLTKPVEITLADIGDVATSMPANIITTYRKHLEKSLIRQLMRAWGKTEAEVRALIGTNYDPLTNPAITAAFPDLEQQAELYGNMVREANSSLSDVVFGPAIAKYFDTFNREEKRYSFVDSEQTVYISLNLDSRRAGSNHYQQINLSVIDGYKPNTTNPEENRLLALFGKDPRGSLRQVAEDIVKAGDTIHINKSSNASIAACKGFFAIGGVHMGGNPFKFEKAIQDFIADKFSGVSDFNIFNKNDSADVTAYLARMAGKLSRTLKSFLNGRGDLMYYSSFIDSDTSTKEEVTSAAEYLLSLRQPSHPEEKITDARKLLEENPSLRTRLIAFLRERNRLDRARRAQEMGVQYDVDANSPGSANRLNLNFVGRYTDILSKMFGSFGEPMDSILANDSELKRLKAEKPIQSAYYIRIIELLQINKQGPLVRQLLAFLNLGFSQGVPDDAFLHRHDKLNPSNMRAAFASDIRDMTNPPDFLKLLYSRWGSDSYLGNNELAPLIQNPFLEIHGSRVTMSAELHRIMGLLENNEGADFTENPATLDINPYNRPSRDELGFGNQEPSRDPKFYTQFFNIDSGAGHNLILNTIGSMDEYKTYQTCINTKIIVSFEVVKDKAKKLKIEKAVIKSLVLACLQPLVAALDKKIKEDDDERERQRKAAVLDRKYIREASAMYDRFLADPSNEANKPLGVAGGLESALRAKFGIPADSPLPENVKLYILILETTTKNNKLREPLEVALGNVKFNLPFFEQLWAEWEKWHGTGVGSGAGAGAGAGSGSGSGTGAGSAPGSGSSSGPGPAPAPTRENPERRAQREAQARRLENKQAAEVGEALNEALGLESDLSTSEKLSEKSDTSLSEAIMNALSSLLDMLTRFGGLARPASQTGNGPNPFTPFPGITPGHGTTEQERSNLERCVSLSDKYVIRGSNAIWISAEPQPPNFNLQLCLQKGITPEILQSSINFLNRIINTIKTFIINAICFIINIPNCNYVLNLSIGSIIGAGLAGENSRLKQRVQEWKTKIAESVDGGFNAEEYFSSEFATMSDMVDFMTIIFMLFIPDGADQELKNAIYGTGDREYNIFGYYKPTTSLSMSSGPILGDYAVRSTAAFSNFSPSVIGGKLIQLFMGPDRVGAASFLWNITSEPLNIIFGDTNAADDTAPIFYGDTGSLEDGSLNPWRVFQKFIKRRQAKADSATAVKAAADAEFLASAFPTINPFNKLKWQIRRDAWDNWKQEKIADANLEFVAKIAASGVTGSFVIGGKTYDLDSIRARYLEITPGYVPPPPLPDTRLFPAVNPIQGRELRLREGNTYKDATFDAIWHGGWENWKKAIKTDPNLEILAEMAAAGIRGTVQVNGITYDLDDIATKWLTPDPSWTYPGEDSKMRFITEFMNSFKDNFGANIYAAFEDKLDELWRAAGQAKPPAEVSFEQAGSSWINYHKPGKTAAAKADERANPRPVYQTATMTGADVIRLISAANPTTDFSDYELMCEGGGEGSVSVDKDAIIPANIWLRITKKNNPSTFRLQKRRRAPPPPPPPLPTASTYYFNYGTNNLGILRSMFADIKNFFRIGSGNKGAAKDKGMYLPFSSLPSTPGAHNVVIKDVNSIAADPKGKWIQSRPDESALQKSNAAKSIASRTGTIDKEFKTFFTKHFGIYFIDDRLPFMFTAEAAKQSEWTSNKDGIKDKYKEVNCGGSAPIYILKTDIEIAVPYFSDYDQELCKLYFRFKNKNLMTWNSTIIGNFANIFSFFDLSIILSQSASRPNVSVDKGTWLFKLDDKSNILEFDTTEKLKDKNYWDRIKAFFGGE